MALVNAAIGEVEFCFVCPVIRLARSYPYNLGGLPRHAGSLLIYPSASNRGHSCLTLRGRGYNRSCRRTWTGEVANNGRGICYIVADCYTRVACRPLNAARLFTIA